MGLLDKLKEQLNEGLSSMDIKIPGLGNAPATPAPQQQQTPVPQQPLASTPTPPPPANPVGEGLYDPRLEKLIELALVDGELRTSANTAVLGGVFFFILLLSHLIFAFTAFHIPAYVIINGILILLFILVVYAVAKTKQ